MPKKRNTPQAPSVSYAIKIVGPRKKSATIEVRSDQTIADLDRIIRQELDYDTWDHCSAFFAGTPWRSEKIAEVFPDGTGENNSLPIHTLGLMPGDKLSYVYDFGDNIAHRLTVENVGGDMFLGS